MTGKGRSSDQTAAKQVADQRRPPGVKTVDDVTVESTSAGDIDPNAQARADAGLAQAGAAHSISQKDLDRYPWVVRHALATGQDPSEAVKAARSGKAPENAVLEKSSGWVTIDQVNPDHVTKMNAVNLVGVRTHIDPLADLAMGVDDPDEQGGPVVQVGPSPVPDEWLTSQGSVVGPPTPGQATPEEEAEARRQVAETGVSAPREEIVDTDDTKRKSK